MNKTSRVSTVISNYKQSLQITLENPSILFLFATVGLLDILAFIILFLAPAWPFSVVLAPIIRAFWDERFLHYPDNFILLPKLLAHAHFVILTGWGIFVSGMVIKKMEAFQAGDTLSLAGAFLAVLKRYFSVLFAWLLSFGIFSFVMKAMIALFPSSLIAQFLIAFTGGIVLQSLFAYLLPVILIENLSFFKSIIPAVKTSVKNIVFTMMLVLLPVLMVAFFSFFKAFAPYFVHFNPEFVGVILLAGIAVTLFSDVLVTVTTTLFYLKIRKQP